MIEVSASILTVQKENAIKEFYNLETSKIDYFHIDVMDGKFVEKNTTEIMKDYSITISHISNLGLDVHLMVDNIEEYVEDYLPLKPQILTFHIEASKDEKRTRKIIDIIKSSGTRVGIAISPETDIEEIKKYLNSIHVVLIMTVIPGKGRTKVNSRNYRKN